MASGVELCNMALLKLGTKFIANFTDTPQGEICGMLLQSCLDDYGTQGLWTWNEKRAEITPNQIEDPDSPGFFIDEPGSYKKFLFTLPSDFIVMRYVKYEGEELTEYYISGPLAMEEDYNPITVIYTARVGASADGEVNLPTYCHDSFTSYLAHRLSPAIDDGNRSMQMLQEAAMKFQQAYGMDLRMRPTKISRKNYHKGV